MMGVLYKRYLIVLLGVLTGCLAFGQDYDSVRLARLPKLTTPVSLKSAGLPYKVDNSRTKHFPPIFTQYGYSCNQAASISVGFTYEINALRNKDAYYEENRLPVFFTWNMMNSGNADTGVSYFESWDMIRAIGCPNWTDYGTSVINATRWMNGYDNYYRGMSNRVEDVYSIDVSNEAGLQTLKHWLYDHLGDYQPGGVANFQIATLDLKFLALPAGTEDAGKLMIPYFSNEVGHAMTFVGYNDSVRYDFNNDGKYTNNLDTNVDGAVNMADWEIGALMCVNTYGTEWGSEGRAYVPYRILPLHPNQGGIWMKSVVVAKPHKSYEPQVTLRTSIRYTDRSKLWITAGVSQNPEATSPQYILDQPVFRYQGGNQPMQGQGPPDASVIEIGIDATPLLSHIESGKQAAFFLVVCEKDPSSTSSGSIIYYSANEYNGGENEHLGTRRDIPINQPFMALPVVLSPDFNAPVIASTQLPSATVGLNYQEQMNASGGIAPYKWHSLENTFTEEQFSAPLPTTVENKILPDGENFDKKTVTLPFDFPYHGKLYREMTINSKGGILFVQNYLFIPYGNDLREMLGLNTALFPFYSTEFKYAEYLDGVYYTSNADEVTVFWNASLTTNGQTSDVNFAAKLYPDGQIEFYYGDFQNKISTPCLIGLTGGSREQSYFPAINATGIFKGLNIRFHRPALPEEFKLSSDGLLSCKPLQSGKTWSIPIYVEDYQGLRSYKELKLSTQATYSGSPELHTPEIHIFPNPVNDRIYVQVESPTSGNIELNIIDLTGKKVLTESYFISAGRTSINIDVDKNLSPGIYLLQITGITNYRSKIYLNNRAG